MTPREVWLSSLGLLPEAWLRTEWFVVLAAFVAVNTVMYVVLSIGHILPKPYLSDWIGSRGRRSQDRSIYAGTAPPHEDPER